MSNSEDTNFGEQFLDDYYAECEEHLTLIRRHVLVMETQIGEGRIDSGLLDELFRSFHTIKGISGMVGLVAAEQLAHSIEGLLRSLRQSEIDLNIDGLERFIQGVALLERVIAARRANEPIPSIEAAIRQLQATSTGSEVRPLVPGRAQATPRVWTVEFTPTAALAEEGININSVRARLQEVGAIVRSTPHVKAEGAISFQFVVETPDDLSSVVEWGHGGLQLVASADVPVRETFQRTLASGSSNLVRVDLTRLDDLMRMIGEVVTTRAHIEEQVKNVKKSLPATDWRTLWETTQAMGRQMKALREGVMRVRMVQIGEIFERMQFVVRDLARETGKRILLDIIGRETEIDKLLVERMMDPLLHLVRNAVSHGLERSDERTAQGKSPEGHLTLRAMTTGENVVIEIIDDGRGVDVAQVRDRAKAKGILEPDAGFDNAQLLEVLCLPGFSTRTEADRESGRGVGMDVAKRTVEALSGTLSLLTEPGKGTRFRIELPLTLAIADALIVTANGQTYAVPQTTVREVIDVDQSQVRALERNEVIAYRDGALPLLRLSKVFNLPKVENSLNGTFHVFVTGTGANALGIAVDRILGHREIVVRALGDQLVQVPGIAGATDLGDERVVLILDVPALRRSNLDGRTTGAGV